MSSSASAPSYCWSRSGTGARQEITQSIQGLGSNLLVVVPYKVNLGSTNIMQQGAPQFALNKFTLRTLETVGKAIGDPERAGAAIQRSMFMSNGNRRFFGIISGTGSNEFDLRGLSAAQGRFFTRAEEDSSRLVIVIGPTVARELFGEQDPIDQYINIKGRKVKVVGIQEPRGRSLMIDQDAFSWMPITTAMRLFGTSNPNLIIVKAESTDTVDAEAAKLNDALEKTFTSDEFTVITQSDILSFAEDITRILTYMLGGLAGISLLVGGIGIMNIMLVSVTERTREIGIRKAVGAKTRDIMLQFLVEAVVLSVMGGTIGVILAYGERASTRP